MTSDREAAPATTPQFDTFISYNSANAEFARDLCTALELKGVRCWLAPRDVAAGQPYADECVRGIEASRSLIFVVTANSIGSPQVLSEIEQAHKRNMPIYPLMIGKLTLSREVDYYISRLHWLEAGSKPIDAVAKTLADVISRGMLWNEAAAPPSLRRTLLYRRTATLRVALMTLAIVAIVGVGAGFLFNRGLKGDFRRLGYVELAPITQPYQSGFPVRVWLLANGVSFRDVRFSTVTTMKDGRNRSQEMRNWPIPEQVGSAESFDLQIPGPIERITTCLDVPSGANGSYARVTQRFTVRATGDRLEVAPISEPTVSRGGDLSHCGTA